MTDDTKPVPPSPDDTKRATVLPPLDDSESIDSWLIRHADFVPQKYWGPIRVLGDAIAALRAERDRIAAECERLRTDAERYRHIRPMFRAFSAHVDGMHSWCATGELARMKGPTFDAAIDAARKV